MNGCDRYIHEQRSFKVYPFSVKAGRSMVIASLLNDTCKSFIKFIPRFEQLCPRSYNLPPRVTESRHNSCRVFGEFTC